METFEEKNYVSKEVIYFKKGAKFCLGEVDTKSLIILIECTICHSVGKTLNGFES